MEIRILIFAAGVLAGLQGSPCFAQFTEAGEAVVPIETNMADEAATSEAEFIGPRVSAPADPQPLTTAAQAQANAVQAWHDAMTSLMLAHMQADPECQPFWQGITFHVSAISFPFLAYSVDPRDFPPGELLVPSEFVVELVRFYGICGTGPNTLLTVQSVLIALQRLSVAYNMTPSRADQILIALRGFEQQLPSDSPLLSHVRQLIGALEDDLRPSSSSHPAGTSP